LRSIHWRELIWREEEVAEGLLLTLAVGWCAVVGCGVVLCEDAGAVVCAEDYDGVDGEEGHAGCHGWVS
jgi:hypothetical protein